MCFGGLFWRLSGTLLGITGVKKLYKTRYFLKICDLGRSEFPLKIEKWNLDSLCDIDFGNVDF